MKSLPVHAAQRSLAASAAPALLMGLVAPALLAFSALLPRPALAAEGGATPEQAVAMVKKGVAFIKKEGKDKGYSEISVKGGQFSFEDLYLVVYGLDGTVHAHGANIKMVGKNLIELKDVDGKAFVKERVELGKAKPSFWQDYKFTNPENKKIEPKSMYCERLEDTVVCGGIYK
ncbi:cache domain-containing protein [Paucibacter sp. DJ2R-2]|uniref:cache domain-containing protein n=1 Tax=Paucibacter sp. DJ2R-2 TaxID=2893558 RepID=UPI0021E50B88|nr:cache domain-containing protein [Paucibacter sp. DJ2R-2]MCV2420798.1 cache domain-containing protein [Paucibacter sp. DJ4R-1]MCV2439997.1 cache domain-containing protein [Paucibacter sp. DJ2R-2]